MYVGRKTQAGTSTNREKSVQVIVATQRKNMSPKEIGQMITAMTNCYRKNDSICHSDDKIDELEKVIFRFTEVKEG